MDDMNTNWIKQEITDEVPSEPDPMVLEDPEGNSCPMDFIKEDPELHVDETENTVLEDPEGNSCPTDFIKEDPELHVDETENTVLASMRCASDSVSQSLHNASFETLNNLCFFLHIETLWPCWLTRPVSHPDCRPCNY
ncbi:uncharacterized protein LOC126426733 isoform X5 [Schistocerca serialis cubense]|uniref:uncharacterized protein LOC126426733 isoform X5 n=1 Tax=Schistocerca serialis cubense TaxID=2023355 RepID=UPI00214E58EA|nr:uncharacterized protein LOC126426733 isoform X5 [Schistocerca serialis cubense]